MSLYHKEEISNKIAEYLLKEQAVTFHTNQPVTWASGIKSPIYCDNRVLLSNHRARTFVRQAISDFITEEMGSVNAIVGVATGGIAHGILVAQALELPFAYVRPAAKEHGKQNSIEGRLNMNDRVVIIEDLISTAKSTINVFNILKANNFHVAGIISIFSYLLPISKKVLESTNCIYHSLCDYNTLINTAQRLEKITPEDCDILTKWKASVC